jgi:hypothetical protein
MDIDFQACCRGSHLASCLDDEFSEAAIVERLRVPRFSSATTMRRVFGDPKARVIILVYGAQ